MGVLRVKGASFFVVFFSFALVRGEKDALDTYDTATTNRTGSVLISKGSKKMFEYLFPVGGGELIDESTARARVPTRSFSPHSRAHSLSLSLSLSLHAS